MKVRNVTGRKVLVADQGKFLRPSRDYQTVEESADLRALIEAGALEVEQEQRSASKQPDQADKKETA